MTRPLATRAKYFAVLALATTTLSACSGWDRLSQVGEAPRLTSIQNPTEAPGYRPVSLPMPQSAPDDNRQANSLWRQGARAFFKDQRAGQIGDVLTVGPGLHQPRREARPRRHRRSVPRHASRRVEIGRCGEQACTTLPPHVEQLAGRHRPTERDRRLCTAVRRQPSCIVGERRRIGERQQRAMVEAPEVRDLVAHGPPRRRRRRIPCGGIDRPHDAVEVVGLGTEVRAQRRHR